MRRLAGIFLILAGLVLAALPAAAQRVGWDWVQPDRVYALLQEGSGVWLVDVRGQVQYEQVHIEGAMNISPLELKYRNYPAQKVFVLVDSTPGQKSAREVAQALVLKGHTNVHVLAGGLPAWELAGLPVVREGEFEAYGVTAGELSWALTNKAAVRVFDVSNIKGLGGAVVPGSKNVTGESRKELVENLRALIAGSGSLSEKLRPSETIVLVSAAAGDARELAREMTLGLNKDVRYLMGGYESYQAQVEGRTGEKKTIGQCPTCPLEEQ
jgi:rhodanese-related sulfurtransferase